MRKSRLVILPTKCLNSIGFLLLFLSCPVIGDWGRIQPESEASHNAIQIAREGTCILKHNLFGGISSFSQNHDLDVGRFDGSNPDINLKSFNSFLKSIETATCNRRNVQVEKVSNNTNVAIVVKKVEKIQMKPSERRLYGSPPQIYRKLVKTVADNRDFRKIQSRSFKTRFSGRIAVPKERVVQPEFLKRNEKINRVLSKNSNFKTELSTLKKLTAEKRDRVFKRRLQRRRYTIPDLKTNEKEKHGELREVLKGIQQGETRSERIPGRQDIHKRISENSLTPVKRETIELNTRNNDPESRLIRFNRFERSNVGSSIIRRKDNEFERKIKNIRLLLKTNRFSINERVERNLNQPQERETGMRLSARRAGSKIILARDRSDRENLDRTLRAHQLEQVKKMEKKTNLSSVRMHEDLGLKRTEFQNRRKQTKSNYSRKMTENMNILKHQTSDEMSREMTKSQTNNRNDKNIQSEYRSKKSFDYYKGLKFEEWTLNCITGMAVYYFTTTYSKFA